MTNFINDVKLFHEVCDNPVLTTPTIISKKRADLRIRLIDEEVNELKEAINNNDLIEIADALGDIIYVVVGTALEFGIPLDKVWEEIQRSNMSKVDVVSGKVLKREDGKVLKGQSYFKPDIKTIIENA